MAASGCAGVILGSRSIPAAGTITGGTQPTGNFRMITDPIRERVQLLRPQFYYRIALQTDCLAFVAQRICAAVYSGLAQLLYNCIT